MEDKDIEVIHHLQKGGSDLSKPHATDFYFYFPTEERAKEAAVRIYQIHPELKADIKQPKLTDTIWILHLVGQVIPLPETMREIRNKFTEIASSLGGDYDGWGAEITK